MIEPFLPFTSAKLLSFLNTDHLNWDKLGSFDLLAEGHTLGKSELLFEKIEDEVVEKQVQKLHDTKELNESVNKNSSENEEAKTKPIKETIEYGDFEKLDIRVGTVLECEKVPKTDKLLRFLLDDGLKQRTILSGIAAYYPNPEELIGKQVCFIANLAPRKMRGFVSEGMILSAENSDGTLALVTPSKDVNPGSLVL